MTRMILTCLLLLTGSGTAYSEQEGEPQHGEHQHGEHQHGEHQHGEHQHGEHQHGEPQDQPTTTRAAEIERAREYFSDVVLVDQNGEYQRLYSDMLQGKTVVISPFFTTCKGVCPLLNQKLAAVQREFGDRLGRDLHLISISVDPENDTVDKLAAYAKRFKAKPGWFFLSGKKENVNWALHRLGHYVEDKEAHSNILLVGNDATGHWKKVLGLSEPKELLLIVQEVLGAEG